MKLLIIVAACVAVTLADSGCGTMERLKVKRQWADAFGVSEDREAMGLAVFRYIFSVEPDSPDEFFSGVNAHNMHSPEFIAHAGRVLSGFDMCLSLLMDEGPLEQELIHLQRQHEELKIPSKFFDIFSRGLRLSVHSLLGRCFDEHAWEACTNLIEDGIKH